MVWKRALAPASDAPGTVGQLRAKRGSPNGPVLREQEVPSESHRPHASVRREGE